MRRIPLLALALLLSLLVPAAVAQDDDGDGPDPSIAPPVQIIEIGRCGPKAGERVSETSTMSNAVKFQVSVDGQVVQAMEQTSTEKSETHTDVLERNDDSITKVRLTYVVSENKATSNGIEQSEPSPTVGKSYTAAFDDEGEVASVANDDGSEVSEEELAAVSGDADDLLAGSPFANALPDKPIAVGDVVELDEEKLAAGLADGDGGKATGKLKLVRVSQINGRESAEFEADLSLTIQPNEMVTMQMTLKGTIIIDVATGVLVRAKATGPAKISGGQQTPDGKIEISGSGTTTIDATAKIVATPSEDGGSGTDE